MTKKRLEFRPPTFDCVYATSQVIGDGPVDLVLVPHDDSNIDANHELPQRDQKLMGVPDRWHLCTVAQ